jgi:hypothetical protein
LARRPRRRRDREDTARVKLNRLTRLRLIRLPWDTNSNNIRTRITLSSCTLSRLMLKRMCRLRRICKLISMLGMLGWGSEVQRMIWGPGSRGRGSRLERRNRCMVSH